MICAGVRPSHLVLAMIGEGKVTYGSREMAAARALKLARLTPVRLSAKEGLALVNGTQMMAAIGASERSHSQAVQDGMFS